MENIDTLRWQKEKDPLRDFLNIFTFRLSSDILYSSSNMNIKGGVHMIEKTTAKYG